MATTVCLILFIAALVATGIYCYHFFVKNKKNLFADNNSTLQSEDFMNNDKKEYDPMVYKKEETIPTVKFYYKDLISKPVKKIYSDAGWDLTTPNDFQLAPGESILIDTNVIADIPENYVGILKSRSGLACKFRIDTANAGVIDSSYRGNIKVLLENRGDTEYIAKAGDRICQILILKCLLNAEFIEGEPNDQTERGKNGFGSSGK